MATIIRHSHSLEPKSGILLTSSPLAVSKHIPNTPSNNSLSSSASTSSHEGTSSSSSHSPRTPAKTSRPVSPPDSRKIRFAPLPDITREDDLDHNISITVQGDLACDMNSENFSSLATPINTSFLLLSSQAPPRPSSPNTSLKPLKTKARSFLNPFGKRPSTPSHDSPTSSEPEDNLALCRVSSRDSRRSTQENNENASWGAPLGRWNSGGSTVRGGSTSDLFGASLSRTQSVGSNDRPSKMSFFSRSSKKKSTGVPLYKSQSLTESRPSPLSASTTPGRKGTKMLNGRVYGGSRSNSNSIKNQNLFATAKSTEPEFVEWGYGGMGSVKAGGGEVWSRLQSNNSSVVTTQKGSTNEDDDGGSGMGWVKRRREQREREAKEKAEREAEEKAKAEVEGEEAPPKAEEDTKVEEDATPAATTPAPISVAEDINPSTPEPPTTATSETHILHAITIPAPPHHHHHKHGHPSHKRTMSLNSAGNSNSNSNTGSDINLVSSPVNENLGREVEQRVRSPLASAGIGPTVESPVSVSDSDSDSDSFDGEKEDDDDDDTDDDDSEDEDMDEKSRKTALGAGVEKISRHNSMTQ